ncbi:MAG: efflux transporter outer membrane subunit [Acidobacteriota bacterium]
MTAGFPLRVAATSLLSGSVLLTGCTVGPNYKKPVVNTPAAYRGAPTLHPDIHTESTTEPAWPETFKDPTLQRLVLTALKNNQDVAVGAARIEQARAEFELASRQQYPDLQGQAGFADQRLSQEGLPGDKVNGNPEGSATFGALNLGWEFDFWGKYRRMREAARARFLATEAAQQAVRISLISAVASDYFQLRAFDAELKTAQQSLALRQQSLTLTEAREKGGVASLLDVRQAQTLVTEAKRAITNLEQEIPLMENQLRLLLGENPGPISRGLPLAAQNIPAIPAGLPSQLLERRPDIRQAEENLRAANADIGVVRADLFPNIGLTSSVGTESSAVSNFLSPNATSWLVQPTIDLPIFTAGRIQAREHEATSAEQAELHAYKATVLGAFQQVSDALIARQKAQELLLEQKHQVEIAQDAAFLSRARYKGGVANYLEVIETERTSLAAKLALAQAEYDELNSSVQLYRALGGGWRGQPISGNP